VRGSVGGAEDGGTGEAGVEAGGGGRGRGGAGRAARELARVPPDLGAAEWAHAQAAAEEAQRARGQAVRGEVRAGQWYGRGGSEVGDEMSDGVALREQVLALVAVARQRRDGVRDRGLHAHRRLLERSGEHGAHPGVEELMQVVLVAAEEAERRGRGLLPVVGAFLDQLDEDSDAVLLDDVLGEVGVAHGEGGGRVVPRHEAAGVEARDVVPDHAKHRLVLRDVGEPPQVAVAVVVLRGRDADEPGDVLERGVEQGEGAHPNCRRATAGCRAAPHGVHRIRGQPRVRADRDGEAGGLLRVEGGVEQAPRVGARTAQGEARRAHAWHGRGGHRRRRDRAQRPPRRVHDGRDRAPRRLRHARLPGRRQGHQGDTRQRVVLHGGRRRDAS
jgi:hypothetical protein